MHHEGAALRRLLEACLQIVCLLFHFDWEWDLSFRCLLNFQGIVDHHSIVRLEINLLDWLLLLSLQLLLFQSRAFLTSIDFFISCEGDQVAELEIIYDLLVFHFCFGVLDNEERIFALQLIHKRDLNWSLCELGLILTQLRFCSNSFLHSDLHEDKIIQHLLDIVCFQNLTIGVSQTLHHFLNFVLV